MQIHHSSKIQTIETQQIKTFSNWGVENRKKKKKMLKGQGKFSMRKQETERLWSSPSSAFEGEYWELLSLLFLCPSNPS